MPRNPTDVLIQMLRADNADIEEIRTDDLGRHFVQWVERTEKDNGPAGIWFYVDEISVRVVVEHIGHPDNAPRR
jgi:hypothetical protein